MCFTQGGTTFDPVTGITVPNIINQFYFRVMDVAADHAVVAFFPAVSGKIAFKFKNKIHCLFHTVLEIPAETPVAKAHAPPDPVEPVVHCEHKVIGPVSQKCYPGRQARDAIKQVAVCDQIASAIQTLVFALVYYLYQPKANAKRYQGSQEFVVIAGHIHHTGAAFGMTQYAPHHIGVALPPAPFVLLYLPGIYDVAHEIQCFTGVVFEKVIERFCLAVSGAEVRVGNTDSAIGMRHHNIIYANTLAPKRQL